MVFFRPGFHPGWPLHEGAFVAKETAAMRELNLRRGFLRCLLVALLSAACATSNILSVNYQLPTRPSVSIPRSVVVVFEDARKDRAFLSPSAREELEGFTDLFALTVSKPGRGGELKGAYPLGPLFTEILRYRLEDSGVKVMPSSAGADAQFTFVLNELQMDFGDRKWSARVAYEGRLLKNGALLSQQAVSGSAERLMFMKKADAEKVIGELVSDTINQMDLATLFKQAGF
jgi:hypothetical protein